GTLALLATGPTGEERARGLITEVPRAAAPFTVTIKPSGHKTVTVSVPADRLSDNAVDQIICTIAEHGERIKILGQGATRGPLGCPLPK
ncbi:hypothetical protein ACFQ07_32995, partial [Actinomadura adrarensis]